METATQRYVVLQADLNYCYKPVVPLLLPSWLIVVKHIQDTVSKPMLVAKQPLVTKNVAMDC